LVGWNEHKIQEALAGLERVISPYKPEFLARMYRARASDLVCSDYKVKISIAI